MKHRLHIIAFLTLSVLLFATSCQKEPLSGYLPKVHIIATGGTIAGTSNGIVFAGVGDGNLNQATLDMAAHQAA